MSRRHPESDANDVRLPAPLPPCVARAATILGFFLIPLTPVSVQAATDVPAHCRALRAEARSTAAVLGIPRVEVSGLKAPRIADVSGTGVLPANGVQARTALAMSALDLLRGRSVLAAADAECERWLARETVESVLQHGATFGEVEALKAGIAELEAALPRADALVDEAEKRLARELVTVLEVDELRVRRLELETKLGEWRHELAMHVSQGAAPALAEVRPALARYEAAATAGLKERAFQRQLSAFRVDVQLGGVPYPEVDWYGMVTVGYSLGQAAQGAAEDEAAAALAEELRTSDAELAARVARFTRAMAESAARLGDELTVIEKHLALQQERLGAARPESERLRHVLAGLELDGFELKARRAYVERLRHERAAVGSALP